MKLRREGFKQLFDVYNPEDRKQVNFYYKSPDFRIEEITQEEGAFRNEVKEYMVYEYLKDNNGKYLLAPDLTTPEYKINLPE